MNIHIFYSTKTTEPVKVTAGNVSKIIKPNTGIEMHNLDKGETLLVETVFRPTEELNFFKWLAVFFRKLILNIPVSILGNFQTMSFSYKDFLGFSLSFEPLTDNITINYNPKSDKREEEKFCLLVNRQETGFSAVFDYDKFKNSSINNLLNALVFDIHFFLIFILVCLIFDRDYLLDLILYAIPFLAILPIAQVAWFFVRRSQIVRQYGKPTKKRNASKEKTTMKQ